MTTSYHYEPVTSQRYDAVSSRTDKRVPPPDIMPHAAAHVSEPSPNLGDAALLDVTS
jgi:hypothetical protein